MPSNPTQVIKVGGDGFYTGGASTGGTKWEAVQLSGGQYLFFGGANSYSATLLASDVALILPGTPILSMGVRMLARGDPSGANARFGLRLGGVDVLDSLQAVGPGSWTPFPATGYTVLARPGGGVWTTTDLATLELIVYGDTASQFDMIDCLAEMPLTGSEGWMSLVKGR
jgi:hypothetical protein